MTAARRAPPRDGRGDRGRESLLPRLNHTPAANLGPGTSFSISVPFSVANVGPGLDRLGLCLDGPSDLLTFSPAPDGFRFETTGDADLPGRPEDNLAALAFREVHRARGRRPTGHLCLRKGFRAGSGIGSSGASAAGGALAAAAALGLPLGDEGVRTTIVRSAAAAEAVAAGTPHLDNVAASLFGGLVLIERADPVLIRRFAPPSGLRLVIAVPDLTIPTRRSRAMLPERVPRSDAVENMARAVALLAAFVRGDARGVGRNLDDRLAVPYRAHLVPGFERARSRAIAAGAFGATMAGSGPALLAVVPPSRAEAVRSAVVESFEEEGMDAVGFGTRVGAGPTWRTV